MKKKEVVNNFSKRIRKDDNVLVISGNNRGKTGKVMRVSGASVFVQGVNLRKKHVKPTRTSKGGIIEMEAPINVSNVKVCVEGNQPVKLRFRESKKGERELYYNDGNKHTTYRSLSKKEVKSGRKKEAKTKVKH